MNYKNPPSLREDIWDILNGERHFLSDEDIFSEIRNSDYPYFRFNDPWVRENFRKICDLLVKDVFPNRIQKIPSGGSVYFVVEKDSGTIRYPGTPERINYVLDCLRKYNFTELENLNRDLFGYDPVENLEISPVKAFGIQLYDGAIRTNVNRGGHFFNYLVKLDTPYKIIEQLKKYQIFPSIVDVNNNSIPELDDCCFVYALKMTKLFPEDILNKIRLRIRNRYLSNKCIDEICLEYKIHLILYYIDDETTYTNKRMKIGCNYKKYIGVKQEEAKYYIEMNLYKQHYFLEEITPFSKYYIKHLKNEPECNYNKELHGQRYQITRYFCKSSDLVRTLMKEDYFIPITYAHYMTLSTEFYKYQDQKNTNYELDYDKKYCTQLLAQPCHDNDVEKRQVFFADFECDVSGEYHRPYLCVVQSEDGKTTKVFRDSNCTQQLLDFLPPKSITYFHNLAYDFRMIGYLGVQETIIKGTRCLKASIGWKDKMLFFKDSLALFNCKLSQLPSMFGLTGVEKELFPYNYYTYTQLAEGETLNDDEDEVLTLGVIEDAGKNEVVPWGEDEYLQFNYNIDKIGARVNGRYFDMYKYAEFYCQQDVRILRESFKIFREGFKKDFNIDVIHFISISSLANEVFNQNVYYPNGNLFKLGGHVRHFCSKAVYGGRCMCAYNKKWHIQANLCDYDAVSLYPSAMARLWTVEGIPKVIEEDQLNMEFLSQQSAFIVEIKITAVHKHYPFPLIVQKINGLNVNCDEITEPINVIVDNIFLEDLINFQQIEFELIKGYYWDGKKDYRIQEEIKKIFQKRVEYKQQKNPLQQLYKLIMNSCYGKTIEKPVEKDAKYIKGDEETERYISKNYNKIVEIVDIRNSNIHSIKEIVPIDQHFNFSLLGIQVLSMSKRIMNEVMCLAYDIGCRIYYQDTDSMHIVKEDLDKLEKAFEAKYHRPLKGTNLGQFHTDFCTYRGREDVEHAVESMFLMKKMYIDKLLLSDSTYDYMFRGKGITTKSILALANEEYEGDLMSLYKSLYNGRSLTFDLTKGQPCFRMASDLSVINVEEFKRKIKTSYEEGNENEYFH